MKRIVMGRRGDVSTIETREGPPAMYLMETDVAAVSQGATQPRRVTESRKRLESGEVELAEIFGSATAIPTVAGDTAATPGAWNLSGPPGGFNYRIATYGPEVETGMHSSQTFDIDVVLSGEVTIVAENGDAAVLHEGDTIVIPGVAHSWRSGPQGCRVAFLMIGVE